MKRLLTNLVAAALICMLAGCAVDGARLEARANAPSNALKVTPVSISASTGSTANPFALDPAGEYFLYAYDSALLGYRDMGFYHYAAGIEPSQESLDAIAAINELPVLEKMADKPAGSADYGLMTVSVDGKYTKRQFFLYKDCLTVNGTAYRINSQQYQTLKAVMEKGGDSSGTVPRWLIYMNPNRITGISCTDENGKMRNMKKDNIGYAASDLQYIYVRSAKTYRPGSKKLDGLPFKAVYTFDSGVTYTVYVSNVKERVDGVTLYLESSDMRYACEYVVDGYISNYVSSTQGMIDGPANPRTM